MFNFVDFQPLKGAFTNMLSIAFSVGTGQEVLGGWV